ncbi:MAG: CPBP family intramembrane metalloprotease [Ignavibacteriae bacterium]|nr:CPBP family intramembrane metalloprotease [Ignavibacteriota bacterium]
MSDFNEQNGSDGTFIQKHFNHLMYGLGVGLGIFFMYQLFGGGLAGIMILTESKEWLWLLQGIGQVVFMLVPTLIAMKYSPLGRKELLRLGGDTTSIQWIAGISGILAIQLFAGSFSTVQNQFIPESIIALFEEMKNQMEKIYTELLGGGGTLNMIKGIAIGAIIPAVSEEVLFRGLMQRSLEQLWSPKRAILWTGVIFGIIHFNPTDVVSLVIIGVYLGVLAYSTRSLALSVIVHFLNNAIAVIAINLSVNNTGELPDGTPAWIAGLLCTSGLAGAILAAMVVIRSRSKNKIV